MYRLLIRALAVVAIALSPVWGYSSVQAGRALTPYWPSFDSVGCNAVGQSFGGVVISCGTGGYVTTQITSAYGGCSQIDIQVNGFGSGPFYTTATAPVAGLQSTVNINDSGDYYMQLSWVPSTIVGPIQIQLSAPDTGNMSVQNITVNPCPVPPTATPVPPTNTPNPSDTATSTATAGPSHTPTTIPTNTPLPSGHNTFTPTPTRTSTPTATATTTGTATPTPPPSYTDCGLGFYDCGVASGSSGPYWFHTSDGITYSGGHAVTIGPGCEAGFCNLFTGQWQVSTALLPAAGQPCFTITWGGAIAYGGGSDQHEAVLAEGTSPTVTMNTTPGTVGWTSAGDPSGVMSACAADAPAGTRLEFSFGAGNESAGYSSLSFHEIYDGASPTPVPTFTPTPTTGPATNTPTPPAGTQTAIAGLTATAVAASYTPTYPPIPGATESPIPTDTPCPGGCAVKALTAIPGQVGTITTVDTSPFSPLKNLSLSRSSCQPFGYAQIPVPVIHGTPALGSTTPLSFTWTVPVTGAWTNYNSDGTLNISNTAIQPCAMSEIPTFVWDLTYWLSVLMCAVAWFLWLIGFVGRLSGEETING